VTKTPRTLSYLRHVTHHHESNQQLLKPPRTLTQRWRILPSHDISGETTLSAQGSSARAGTIPLLQDAGLLTIKTAQTAESAHHRSVPTTGGHKAPHLYEFLPVRHQQAQGEVQHGALPHLPSASPPHQRADIKSPTPLNTAPASTEDGVRHQQAQGEIQLAPAQSRRGVAGETSRVSNTNQIISDRQTRDSDKGKSASVTLRPPSRQQQEATSTLTNIRGTADLAGLGSKASAKAHERLAILADKQKMQQHPAIHIGTIDIQIVPSVPAAPLPTARSARARSHSTPALSREMTSLIGLRQG
jgi:hypothetical protein